MQIVLPWLGQKPNLESWERELPSRGVERGPGRRDNRDSYVRILAAEEPGEPEANGAFRRVAGAILRYEIFPPWLVTGVLRHVPVELGDTVGICYHCCPGLDLFFAARVIERFDEQAGSIWRTGFTYRTLRGHPELGEETFSAEKDLATGKVTAALRSWSRPGILLAWLGYPFTRVIQKFASRVALDHLQEAARAPSLVRVGAKV
jgi:uncharacterized protein (UPF0548 family)